MDRLRKARALAVREVSNVQFGPMLLKEIQGIYEGKGVVLDRPEHYEMIPTVVFARVSGADGTEKGAGYALFQYPTSFARGRSLGSKNWKWSVRWACAQGMEVGGPVLHRARTGVDIGARNLWVNDIDTSFPYRRQQHQLQRPLS